MPANHPTLGSYVVPPLPFSFDALERAVGAETMRMHYDTRHQG